MKKNIVKMSLVAAMLLSTGAYAGTIIGANPGDEVFENTQFGFGGWYFDENNIEVQMYKADGTAFGTFNQADGTYTAMSIGDYFVSSIYDEPEGNHLANIGGKDYPVGEPAGIKIINGDTKTNNGKPENCIMTTSYLSADKNNGVDGLLNTTVPAGPDPVICSSPFQSHKRFKVLMLETMVNNPGELGNPVELKFDLDNDDNSTGIVRYQVFQKINNYTGLRLNGYTLRVLDENGTENPNITLSLGIGENDTKDPAEDIWGDNEFANFAHGLWGPPDNHFPEQGFFDDLRAYYPVELNEANNTISYAGDMLGGNYQELFGNWLKSEWAPTGIFYDFDNDPSTDADLVAFWGVPPGVDPANIGWYQGEAAGWAPVDVTTLLTWAVNPLYNMGLIEDVLNLGVNYIVEVGDNSLIGDTFTIEITPHADTNITAPIHMSVAPSLPAIPSVGTIAMVPDPFAPGDTLTIAVADADLNEEDNVSETTVVLVAVGTDETNVTLTETDDNSSVFTGTYVTDGALANGTVVTATYIDVSEDNATRTATATADDGTVTPPIISGGGSGGGCTYNPNSKNFDMTFLMMMALGLLYPFRRRFLK